VLTVGAQLGVHGQAREAALAVVEPVDLGDEEHREHGPGERHGQPIPQGESAFQGARHQLSGHEPVGPELAGRRLEPSGALYRPRRPRAGVPSLKLMGQFGPGAGNIALPAGRR